MKKNTGSTGSKGTGDDAAEVFEVRQERSTCLYAAFKDNDQLKTNTALQMESAKIEFKII
jgi:hypothetical protein